SLGLDLPLRLFLAAEWHPQEDGLSRSERTDRRTGNLRLQRIRHAQHCQGAQHLCRGDHLLLNRQPAAAGVRLWQRRVLDPGHPALQRSHQPRVLEQGGASDRPERCWSRATPTTRWATARPKSAMPPTATRSAPTPHPLPASPSRTPSPRLIRPDRTAPGWSSTNYDAASLCYTDRWGKWLSGGLFFRSRCGSSLLSRFFLEF